MLLTSQTPGSCGTLPISELKEIAAPSTPHETSSLSSWCPCRGVMREWQYEGLPGRKFSQPRKDLLDRLCGCRAILPMTGIIREELKITYDTSLTCARYGKTSYLSPAPHRPQSIRIRAFPDGLTKMLALKAILLLALLHEGNCQCGKLGT